MLRTVLVGMALAGWVVTVGGAPAEAQKKDRYLLTVQEINERQDLLTAYDAVKQLRSQWLKPARPKGDLGGAAFASSPYRPKPETKDGGAGAQDASAEAAASARDAQRNEAARKRVDPILYIDEMRQPDLEDGLRTVRIAEIVEIRYMNGNEALARYGAGHDAGAILLRTLRAPR